MANKELLEKPTKTGLILNEVIQTKLESGLPLAQFGGEDEGFLLILEKIRRNKGLDFTLYRPASVKRRILSRMRATGSKNYSEYIVCLNRDPSEYDRVLEAITINVTEFFRDTETFRHIQEKVIPEIVARKEAEGRKIIRVWSAGSSFGEETYSLAILFLECLGARISEFMVKVYGTDIDPDCLSKARAGIYAHTSLRHVPKQILERYFTKDSEFHSVKNEVRSLIRFQHHDLVSDKYMEHMDLILCRNVVIYFSRPLQDFVYANFAKALNEGGFLILGKVESLWGYPTSYFETISLRERIYKKKP